MTLKDIAERLNVSVAVVSTTLSGSDNGIHVSETTRRKITQLAGRLGYAPKLQPRTLTKTAVRSNRVAIFCLPWSDPLLGETTVELSRTLGEWKFQPFLHIAADPVSSCQIGVKLYQEGEAGALIMMGSRSRPEDVAVGDVPCVVIGEAPSGQRVWRVCTHNVHGGRLEPIRKPQRHDR